MEIDEKSLDDIFAKLEEIFKVAYEIGELLKDKPCD
jgi:hypothetical protein